MRLDLIGDIVAGKRQSLTKLDLYYDRPSGREIVRRGLGHSRREPLRLRDLAMLEDLQISTWLLSSPMQVRPLSFFLFRKLAKYPS